MHVSRQKRNGVALQYIHYHTTTAKGMTICPTSPVNYRTRQYNAIYINIRSIYQTSIYGRKKIYINAFYLFFYFSIHIFIIIKLATRGGSG